MSLVGIVTALDEQHFESSGVESEDDAVGGHAGMGIAVVVFQFVRHRLGDISRCSKLFYTISRCFNVKRISNTCFMVEAKVHIYLLLGKGMPCF